MMKSIIAFYNRAKDALGRGAYLGKIIESPQTAKLMRMQDIPSDKFKERAEEMIREMDAGLGGIVLGEGKT